MNLDYDPDNLTRFISKQYEYFNLFKATPGPYPLFLFPIGIYALPDNVRWEFLPEKIKYYAIKSTSEAQRYWTNIFLRTNTLNMLNQIAQSNKTAQEIFGPDLWKFRSFLLTFQVANPNAKIFDYLLVNKF